jgi:3-oxoacyl-[acyl-carrier protein] reductase
MAKSSLSKAMTADSRISKGDDALKRLEGKAAFVTGASRGIGAAIAEELAANGAEVVISYFNSASEAENVVAAIRKHGVKGEAVRADAGDGAAVRASVHAAYAALGRLDILVNNAGMFERVPLHESTDEQFDRVMAVNLRGAYIAIKEAVPLMVKGGRVINISSTFGSRVPAPGLGLYATSKFALAGLTRALARDLAPLGITVNAIQPGPIATDMNRDAGSHARIMSMMTALGHYGAPADIGKAAAFLASDDSAYITGATLNVDGGFET